MNLTQQRSDDKQVVLVAYKHLGALETQQDKLAVVDEIFADNAYTLLDAVDGDALIEWGRSNVFTGNRRAEFKAKVYHAVKYRKVEAVELSWVYRKCSYKSKALVDGNGIIYDNIASFALDRDAVADAKAENVKFNRSSPNAAINTLPQNIAETRYGETFEISDYSDSRMLITGKKAWEYKIRLMSVFDKDGKLCNLSCSAYSESTMGWTCSSDARHRSGEMFKTDYNEYEWEWEYADARSASSQGSNGNKIHRP